MAPHKRNTQLRVVKHNRPQLAPPVLLCDEKLHKRLDNYPLTSLMNKAFSALILGRAGTGKTSLLVMLLTNYHLYRQVFDRIYAFIPSNSRASLKDDIFSLLPEDQVFDQLNLTNLQEAFHGAEELSRKGKKTLIVFDDVQQFFKGECEGFITHMINNRRHNKLSMIFLAQSYKKVPRMCRLAMTDLFCFRLSRSDLDDIRTELVDIDEETWDKIVRSYRIRVRTDQRLYMYLNVASSRVFFGWDEIQYDEEDDLNELQVEK